MQFEIFTEDFVVVTDNILGCFVESKSFTKLLNSPLLAKSKVFKNYALFAPEYEPEKLKNELSKDFQDCFLPNIPIELILNRYSGSLHKSLKLNKFEFLSRTALFSVVLFKPR